MSKFKLVVILLLLGVSAWSVVGYINKNKIEVPEDEKLIFADEQVQQSAENFANEFKNLVAKRRWYRAKKMCQNPQDEMMDFYLENMKDFGRDNWQVQAVSNNRKYPNKYNVTLVNEKNQTAVMICYGQQGSNWKFSGFIRTAKTAKN